MNRTLNNFTKFLSAVLLNLVFLVNSSPIYAAMILNSTVSINVPLPTKTFRPNEVIPTYIDALPQNASSPFSGTWTGPADPAWHGTFNGSGFRPINANVTGVSTYDFTDLNGGILPVSTFFHISDLDKGGAPNETLILKAFDAMGGPLDSWLNVPEWISGGTVTNDPNDPNLASALPSYIWDPVSFTYTFDGSTESFPTNPSVVFTMLNNKAIGTLEVNKNTGLGGFSIGAPLAVVPAPISMYLIALGLVVLIISARKRALV